jgi:hemoglobin
MQANGLKCKGRCRQFETYGAISVDRELGLQECPTDPRDNHGMQIQEPTSESTPYAQLGAEQGVRALVDRFYDLMELDERFVAIRALHPPSLDSSRDKLFWFLSGWLGGPSLYIERFGHPKLRARHLPFAIASRERDQWMTCMVQAMHDREVPAQLAQALEKAFFGTADWMRNKPD